MADSIQDKSKAVWAVNGNEAMAYAALHAGLDYFAHYPGSPVNGIEPKLKQLNEWHNAGIVFNDALNEHVAALAAMGASMSGARSMLVMKHVGLNIAADPLNYVGYAGVKGGMLIVVGTDPGANSSTGEEDVHWYAKQFNLPLLEPTSPQALYNCCLDGFELSERLGLPVLIFATGLICHQSTRLEIREGRAEKRQFYFEKDRERYINVGQRAVRNHRLLIEKMEAFALQNEGIEVKGDPAHSLVVLTRGNSSLHFAEVRQMIPELENALWVQVTGVYPFPKKAILPYLVDKKEILIIEDQDGFLEHLLKMECYNELQATIHGKDLFPAYGELRVNEILEILCAHFDQPYPFAGLPALEIPERLGTFCEGCPHTGSYFAIEQALPAQTRIIGGDIGCSSLPPFRADWLLCMNAGIGMAQGMAPFVKNQQLLSTGGDGSFFHGGLLAVLNAVHNNIDLVHLVFDNKSVAMTGHQVSASTVVDYRAVVEGLGVASFVEASAFHPKELERLIQAKEAQKGVHVIWVSGACARIPDERATFRRANYAPQIDATKCASCTLCYEALACPAIDQNPLGNFEIDLNRCMRCGVCHEICPNGAINLHPKNESA
jgi:indolepyruvate ferredoxin oxidoreductase alpha subunit